MSLYTEGLGLLAYTLQYQMQTRGRGVRVSQIFADVIFVCSLIGLVRLLHEVRRDDDGGPAGGAVDEEGPAFDRLSQRKLAVG